MSRTRIFVRGKSVREWSEILSIKLCTAWKRYKNGTLELYIDGHLPNKYFGLTVKQIEERLNRKSCSVYQYIKDGTLERRLNGEVIPRNTHCPIIIDNLTTADCQAILGVTRERIRQLKERGLLRDRLNGINTKEQACEKNRIRINNLRKIIRNQRKPGESMRQLSNRIGIAYSTVLNAFDGPVPFRKERRELEKKIIDQNQRKPGESINQFAARIGMDDGTVRMVCGKVPFAQERKMMKCNKVSIK